MKIHTIIFIIIIIIFIIFVRSSIACTFQVHSAERPAEIMG